MAAYDTLADLDLRGAGGRKIEVGSGSEPDHPDSLSGGDGISGFLPAHNPPGDKAGDLAHEDGATGGLEKPGLIFVTNIDFEVSGIEKFTSRVVGFFNGARKGAAVDVDIQDGEENADAAKLPEAERGVFRFVDTYHPAVGGADEGEWIGRRCAFRIPEEEQQANQEEGS